MKTKEEIEEARFVFAMSAITVTDEKAQLVIRASFDLLSWILDEPNGYEECVMTPYKAELAQQVKAE